MIRIAVPVALGMLLAGCGEQPFALADPEDAVPAGDVRLQPGLYRMQITIAGPGGGAAGSQFADDTQCLTPADVAGGYREMLLDMQGRDACRFTRYALADDRLDAVMTCRGDESQPQTEARITGTVTSTATDLSMTVAGFGDGAKGSGAGGIAMQVASERIGECS